MNYIIIGVLIFVALGVYGYISTAKGVKKAPEHLNNAKQKFAQGESNSALKELGKAFVIPVSDKITPEYNAHLLQVLDVLKQVLSGMNISSDKMIDPLYKRLSEATKTIELQENLYKPVEKFFENTESDADLVAYLIKAALSGEINISDAGDNEGPQTSDRTMEVVNKAGKLIMKGEPLQAADVYKQALTQSWDKHDEAFLYDQLGSCYLMGNDLETAEANYKKSISIEAYFQNVWNYCDFLVYNKRKADAEAQISLLPKLIVSKSDQKEFDKLYKNYEAL